MQIELKKPTELLRLSAGDVVTKRNLYDLIQYSKVEGSEYWAGDGNQIGNTPQQGINWLGAPPECQAVLIKTRPGSYQDDGWQDDSEIAYHYSFKSAKDRISYAEKANAVLINQPQYGYPILLFTESGNSWAYEGSFSVTQLQDSYVVLERSHHVTHQREDGPEVRGYTEGDRKYVSHLMAERNRSVVARLKATSEHVCDICGVRLVERYGVECIEAHHKTPISTFSTVHAVDLGDFVLLCPNCHRAVHQYMKQQGLEYPEIKRIVAGKAAQQGAPADRQPATRAAGG